MSDLFFSEENLTNSLGQFPTSSTPINSIINSSDSFLDPNAKTAILNPQIDFIFTRRQKEFVLNLINLQHSSSKAIKRKVSKGLKNLANLSHKDQILAWQNKESDRETFLNLSNCLAKIDLITNDEDGNKEILIYSIGEICKLIKSQIGDQQYTIEAELNDVKFYNTLVYFVLKDPESEQLIYGYMPTSTASRLDFPLNDGLNIVVTGKFTINKRSSLNFVVSQMRLTGDGELKRNLKLLQEKLEQEGLFDQITKRPLIQIPQKILLIASSQGAAIGDYIKVLGERRAGIIIYHLPIKTQGQSAEGLLLEKLNSVNAITTKHQIDTVVITRGGGGKDDLALFNSEKIVRAIKSLNKPTIVAIGHEQDITLAELVADKRASTPSNAAMLTSLSENEIIANITNLTNQSNAIINQRINQARNYLNRLNYNLSREAQNLIHYQKQKLTNISVYLENYLGQLQAKINQDFQFINFEIKTVVKNAKNQNSFIWREIINLTERLLSENKNKLEIANLKIASLDYRNILKQGYAVITQNNQVITHKNSFDQEKPLEIEWQDGSLELK